MSNEILYYQPYATDQLIQNVLDADMTKNKFDRLAAIRHWTDYNLTLPRRLDPKQIRPASDVLIVGKGYTKEQAEEVSEKLKEDAASEFLLVTSLENYKYAKEMFGRAPEVVLNTADPLTQLSKEEIDNTFFLHSIDIRTAMPPDKMLLFYTDRGYAKEVIGLYKNISIVQTYGEPIITILYILRKYSYSNFHFLMPYEVTEEQKNARSFPVDAIKGRGYATFEDIVANTLTKTWIKALPKKPRINLILHHPEENIFGFKVKRIKKEWSK